MRMGLKRFVGNRALGTLEVGSGSGEYDKDRLALEKGRRSGEALHVCIPYNIKKVEWIEDFVDATLEI